MEIIEEFSSLLKLKHIERNMIYEGGSIGNFSDDPISKIMKVGISGGFRRRNVKNSKRTAYTVLFTTSNHEFWKDYLENGIFYYYGDKKSTETSINKTKPGGNRYLEEIFRLSLSKEGREFIGPIFIFQKHPTIKSSRSVKFLGLAVPGNYLKKNSSGLTVVEHSNAKVKIQNYLAEFSIVNERKINLDWLNDCFLNHSLSNNSPSTWKDYIINGLLSDIFA